MLKENVTEKIIKRGGAREGAGRKKRLSYAYLFSKFFLRDAF